MPGITVRAKGVASSQTEVLVEAVIPFLSPFFTKLDGGCHTGDSINPVHTVSPTLVIP